MHWQSFSAHRPIRSFAHEGNLAKVKLWVDGNRHRRFFNAMLNATDR
jgi:hypothetical protein